MKKRFRTISLGIAAITLTALVGCSGGSTPTADSPEQSTETAADATADTAASEAAPAELTSEVKGKYRVYEGYTAPRPGADPIALAAQVQGLPPLDSANQQVKLTTPKDKTDRAIVFRTVNGLQDDSISSIRYRYDFVQTKNSSAEQPQWKLVRVSSQQKCQQGRGSQEWSPELCQ